ncbi:hypothetical protein [Kluyvera intermedia]|uniref:hypothetical protein n=1 Tax=Kluyvera intermedia TaxID=61648 RepID=UPI00352326C9
MPADDGNCDERKSVPGKAKMSGILRNSMIFCVQKHTLSGAFIKRSDGYISEIEGKNQIEQ